jgi:hypothetical protein
MGDANHLEHKFDPSGRCTVCGCSRSNASIYGIPCDERKLRYLEDHEGRPTGGEAESRVPSADARSERAASEELRRVERKAPRPAETRADFVRRSSLAWYSAVLLGCSSVLAAKWLTEVGLAWVRQAYFTWGPGMLARENTTAWFSFCGTIVLLFLGLHFLMRYFYNEKSDIWVMAVGVACLSASGGVQGYWFHIGGPDWAEHMFHFSRFASFWGWWGYWGLFLASGALLLASAYCLFLRKVWIAARYKPWYSGMER